MSRRAHEVLETVDTVVGYTTYIDLVRDLVRDKEIVSTGMKKEVDRIEAAIRIALDGRRCAIVSSGDAGVYAMAGLTFEICQKKSVSLTGLPSRADGGMEKAEANAAGLRVEVVPGIPALCSGAALLGAPLTHDFAAISLSDLLTPWETIESRIDAAARADFVIVLYNPKSKKRDWQLAKACEIVCRHRSGDTPVGIVTKAMREGQSVRVLRLADLAGAPVDMLTTVFIGNSTTTTYMDFMITPRGYSRKYNLEK